MTSPRSLTGSTSSGFSRTGTSFDLTSTNRWSHRATVTAPPATTHCTWRGRDAALNGYTDYTAKEIDEQPEAVTRVLDELGDDGERDALGWAWAGRPSNVCMSSDAARR